MHIAETTGQRQAVTGTIPDQAYRAMQPYLFSVAYRMTGSASDAEDLVHDAWIRYLDAGSPAVASLRAYLTTIVSRLALDHLKSARKQRESYLGPWMPEPVPTTAALGGPAETIEQRESVSIAYLTLLEHLTPEQRITWVLREGFGLSYEEIGRHLGRPAATCRQYYHRAAARLREARPRSVTAPGAHSRILERFLAAVATGNMPEVVATLAPDAQWISDGGPDRLASRHPITGRDKVARGLVGLNRKLGQAGPRWFDVRDLNGVPAVVMLDRQGIERVILLDIAGDRVATVRMILNPRKLRYLEQIIGPDLARRPYGAD